MRMKTKATNREKISANPISENVITVVLEDPEPLALSLHFI